MAPAVKREALESALAKGLVAGEKQMAKQTMDHGKLTYAQGTAISVKYLINELVSAGVVELDRPPSHRHRS